MTAAGKKGVGSISVRTGTTLLNLAAAPMKNGIEIKFESKDGMPKDARWLQFVFWTFIDEDGKEVKDLGGQKPGFFPLPKIDKEGNPVGVDVMTGLENGTILDTGSIDPNRIFYSDPFPKGIISPVRRGPNELVIFDRPHPGATTIATNAKLATASFSTFLIIDGVPRYSIRWTMDWFNPTPGKGQWNPPKYSKPFGKEYNPGDALPLELRQKMFSLGYQPVFEQDKFKEYKPLVVPNPFLVKKP